MDTYRRSQIPLKLVLIAIIAVIVNGCLVLGLQVLLNYRAEGPIDETALAKLNSDYEGCTIWDQTQNVHSADNDIFVFLVEKADGSEHLVTVRKHYLFDRYRMVKSGCKEVSEGTESMQLRSGTSIFNIELSFNAVSGHTDIRWGSWSGQQSNIQFRNTMMLCITALCALELAVWCLVFRKEEIA